MASEEQTTMSGQGGASEEMVKTLTEISHKLDEVLTEVRNLSSRLSAVEGKLETGRASDGAGVVESDPSTNAALYREVEKIRDSIVACDMCNHSTRHLIIYGIEEKPGENVDMTIRQFLHGVLDVKDIKASAFPFYAYRVRPSMPADAYAPILVKFRSYEDKTYVLGKAGKKKKQLASMGIGIASG